MMRPPLAGLLDGFQVLVPGRQADFESFFYYTILGAGVAVLVGIGAVLVYRVIRPMWRDGNQVGALLIAGSTTFFCLFFVGMALTALIGATHHPATPPDFSVQEPR